jgi:hypothetical protein
MESIWKEVVPISLECLRKTTKKPQSGQLQSWLRFKLCNSQIQVYSGPVRPTYSVKISSIGTQEHRCFCSSQFKTQDFSPVLPNILLFTAEVTSGITKVKAAMAGREKCNLQKSTFAWVMVSVALTGN